MHSLHIEQLRRVCGVSDLRYAQFLKRQLSLPVWKISQFLKPATM